MADLDEVAEAYLNDEADLEDVLNNEARLDRGVKGVSEASDPVINAVINWLDSVGAEGVIDEFLGAQNPEVDFRYVPSSAENPQEVAERIENSANSAEVDVEGPQDLLFVNARVNVSIE